MEKTELQQGLKSRLDYNICSIEGCDNIGTNTIGILVAGDSPADSDNGFSKSRDEQDNNDGSTDKLHFSLVCDRHYTEMMSKYYHRAA